MRKSKGRYAKRTRAVILRDKFRIEILHKHLEKKLQERIIDLIKREYGDLVWFYKAHDECTVGVPDIIMCFYGIFVAIELKREKVLSKFENSQSVEKEPEGSPIQAYNIRQIKKARGIAFVSNDAEKIMEKLERVRKTLVGEFK